MIQILQNYIVFPNISRFHKALQLEILPSIQLLNFPFFAENFISKNAKIFEKNLWKASDHTN